MGCTRRKQANSNSQSHLLVFFADQLPEVKQGGPMTTNPLFDSRQAFLSLCTVGCLEYKPALQVSYS
jgi:hypothetical protein